MSKPPNSVPCEVCGAGALGCRVMKDGNPRCCGKAPLEQERWKLVTRLPGGTAVYTPRKKRPPPPKLPAVAKDASSDNAIGEASEADDPAPTDAFSPFPLDMLPAPVAKYAREHAVAMGCDPSTIAVPVLVAMAGAIGNTRIVTIKRRWSEPAILWATLVLRSGDKKSPALEAAIFPLRLRQEQRIAEYHAALLGHKKAVETWETEDKKTRGRAPLPPTCVRYTVEDTTMEALALRLNENPRGLLLVRDELAGFFGSFNQYRAKGVGADEANWLKFFNARPYMNDRKGDGGKLIYLPRPSVSILGTIQPGTLRRILTPDRFESGMAARFLTVCPPFRISQWSDAETDPATDDAMVAIFDRLLEIPLAINAENVPVPFAVGIARDAKQLFERFYNAHNLEIPSLDEDQASAWKKLEGYCPRLALVLHMAEWACQDCPGETGAIQPATMEAAIRLTGWFAAETLRVYATLREAPEDREERELVEWVRRNGGRVSARDVQRGPARFRKSVELATAALSQLVAAGLGRWEFDPPGSDGGPGTQYFRLAG